MRVGVVGGTFDPVHIAHLVIADQSCWQYDLDRIMFVPSARPPHKQDMEYTSAEIRLRMAELATSPDDRFATSAVELERGGLSYTVDTIRQLKEEHPAGTEMFLVVGADALLDMSEWKEPDRLLAECRILVSARPGYSLDLLEEAIPQRTSSGDPSMSRIMKVEAPSLEISSTDIRNRVREGRPYRYLVPGPVWGLIQEKRLYR